MTMQVTMQGRWLVVVSLITIALGLTAWQVMTFSPFDQPLTLGLVDMDKLVKGYKTLQEDEAQYQQAVAKRKEMLRVRELLDKREWEELSSLEKKGEEKLTGAERKRLDELRKLTEERQAEIQRLQLKTPLGEEERKRLEYLLNLLKSNQERLQEMAQQFERELMEINKIMTQDHTNRIKGAAKLVAEELKLKLITVVDDNLVLYFEPTLDVTDRLLTILNASK